MSARTRALLLRLAATIEVGECDLYLRRTLRDLGMDDAAIDRAVARVRQVVEDEHV